MAAEQRRKLADAGQAEQQELRQRLAATHEEAKEQVAQKAKEADELAERLRQQVCVLALCCSHLASAGLRVKQCGSTARVTPRSCWHAAPPAHALHRATYCSSKPESGPRCRPRLPTCRCVARVGVL